MLDSGAKVETATDFAEPGEMGLTFERYYNSRYACDDNATWCSREGSWTTNLDYALEVVCLAVPDNPGDKPQPTPCGPAIFRRPDGSRLSFPSTTQIFAGSTNAYLSGPFDGEGTATLTHNSDDTYTVHDEDARDLTFDRDGHLLSIKDESGIGWTLTRPDANTVVVTHTDGQSFTVAHVSGTGAYGQAEEIDVTDPAGHVYVYHSTGGYADTFNQPTTQLGVIDSVTLPGSPSTVIGYQYLADDASTSRYAQLKEVDYNGTAHDLTTYDSAGRANMTSLADGSEKTSIVYGSNSTGPTATLTDALGHVDVYQFNSSGLLVSISGQPSANCEASYAENTYDANGFMTSSTDNNGNVTQYTYDAHGLLQKQVEAAGTAVQRTTDYAWDPTTGTDRLLGATVEGYAKTAYTYDSHNRMASVAVTNLTGHGTANQTLTTTYTYALYGNGLVHTLTVTPPSGSGDATVYTYDSLGRLSSKANGLGQATTYGNYNALGEPGQVVGPNGDETDYTYDARGRVATKVTHPNGGTATWSYTYDGFGLPATLTEPDGVVTTWTRDAAMRVTSLTRTDKDGTSTETFGYDANGDVTSHVVKRGSDIGLSESMRYDELGRLIEKDGTNGQKQTYHYDLDGHVTSVTNALGHTVAYQYDALNRVTKVTESGGATLGVPTLSVPSSSTSGSYTVGWNAVGAATSYTLQEQVNGGSWSTVYTGAATSKAFAGKGNGRYTYRVEGCNGGGCGGWSTTAGLTVSLPPPAPTNVYNNDTIKNIKVESITVVWDAASTATSYNVKDLTRGTVVYSGTATSYGAASGAPPLDDDGYAVQACNASGCSAWVDAVYRQLIAAPAGAPTLTVPASSTGSYTVSWTPPYPASTVTLQEQVNGGSWSTAYSGSATSKAFSGKGNGTYGYRAQGCSSGGCGPWSSTANVVVSTPRPPPAPTHVRDTIQGTKVLMAYVKWDAVSTATSYQVRLNSNSDPTDTVTTNSYFLGSATPPDIPPQPTAYVRACNASGCSAWVQS
jgi:YD repeat-containing protein